MNYIALAYTKYNTGSFKEAVSLCEKAERICPYRPTSYLVVTGLSYQGVGKYEEAIAIFIDLLDRAQKGEFNILLAQHYLTVTYAMQGNMSKARFHAAELLKINPNYSLEFARRTAPFKNPKHLDAFLDAMRKAGIPDTPPKKD